VLFCFVCVFASAIAEQKLFVGYFQSWSERWVSNGADSTLAKLPAYCNVVMLSFMQPDASYAGGLNLGGTGLQFPYDGKTLKQAVDALKSRNPSTKVLVSVGGATFTNWQGLNVNSIRQFVNDFGLDGVDVDYEPDSPGCQVGSDGLMHCQIDDLYVSIVTRLKAAKPSMILSIAAFSVGAYGEGKWKNSQPSSAHTGQSLGLLRKAASQIQLVNVMSYDAGNSYNPQEAMEAYLYYSHGNVTVGVEIPPEAWGGHVVSISEVQSLTNAVQKENAAGMMLWSIQKKSGQPPSPTYPDANLIAKTICQAMSLPSCDQPIQP